MNMGVQVSVLSPFSSPGRIPRSGIAGSYSDSVQFLRNCCAASTAAAPFHVPVSNAQGFLFFHIFADTCCFLFCFVFLILAILMGVKWYLIVALFL